MLHNETRNLLIQAYNKTHNAKEVAECFSVDVSTVYRLVEQMKREGSVSVKTSLRGRKASLKEADLQKNTRTCITKTRYYTPGNYRYPSAKNLHRNCQKSINKTGIFL